jgi:hypothetical protein
VESYNEVYLRAKRLLAEEPEKILPELDRVLGAADRNLGARLERTVRLTEMCLVAKLDAWWAGPFQSNIRGAIGKLPRAVHDPIALGLGLRLGVGYARMGRVDDEAHRLATLATRLVGTELPHPDDGYADEGARYLIEALFLPSAEYAYGLVKERTPEEVLELARPHLQRGNPSLAALFGEMRIMRDLDDWYVGTPMNNIETALSLYREQRPLPLQELAIFLARAYVKGAFVDLRARDHVLAMLEGDEAKLVGPEEAVGFQDYVDRGCFDFSYQHLYDLAKVFTPDELRDAVRKHTRNGDLTSAQRLCEMILVRHFDDWYLGSPTSNVKQSIARYLDTPLGADSDNDWCARYLAGLYAATLDAAPHAQKLVAALVERDSESAVFAEALHAAGIPSDVTAEELHVLYRDVVEVDARVDAFKAMAEDAGGLSEYEQKAFTDVLQFLEQDEGSVLEDMAQTLGSLVEVVASDSLVGSVTAVVEDVLRLAATGANATLRRDRILGQLAQRDPALRTLDKIRDADLELVDEVAWSVTLENRVVATLEGLGCGLGGPTLVLVDLPMLILVNLNAIASVATAYGFDVDQATERDFMIGLLAGGPTALRSLVAEQGAKERTEGPLTEIGGEHLAGNQAALALHAASAKIASRLARQKVFQLLPILGGAIGAGLNYHFTHTTSRTAVLAYRYRWLVRRFLS